MKPTESAFPYTYDFYKNGQRNIQVYTGMDIRTYLAGQAMQGMLAHATRYRPRSGASQNWHEAISEEAIQLADALIEQLNKEQK